MKVLGIETTTKIGTVAIVEDGKVLGEEVISQEMKHAGNFEKTLGILQHKTGINLNNLDGFAVSVGPGSFTGIRVGVAIAYGLNFSLGKNVVGVPTLKVLAHHSPERMKRLCPIIAGESGEIYGALYEWQENELHEIVSEFSVKIADLKETIQCDAFVFGPAVGQYRDLLLDVVDEKYLYHKLVYPSAHLVAELGSVMLEAGKNSCKPRYIKPLKVLQKLK